MDFRNNYKNLSLFSQLGYKEQRKLLMAPTLKSVDQTKIIKQERQARQA